MKFVPSGSPRKVPLTEFEPVLLMIVNCWPIDAVNGAEMLSRPLVSVTLLAATWS